MITLRGKYNSANIMLDELDEGVTSQIYTFLNHPAFQNSYIAVMPDTHVGVGSCIGFTMKFNGYVIPNLVGVDIGCGVLCVPMNVKRQDINLADFDNMVKVKVPLGPKHHNKPVSTDYEISLSVLQLCKIIGMDESLAMNSIGTLGGGNHFIEIDVDDEDNCYLMIHSGSRNFGLQVANYHQHKAKEFVRSAFINGIPAGLEFLIMGSGGEDYLHHMVVAQKYAALNRATIAYLLGFSIKDSFDTVHNYIGDDNIIRKGAIQAYTNQKCVIPFNMKDGVAICVGKSNSKWNYSAPHGAGRLLSRSKAKEQLDVDSFVAEMQEAGIYTTTANRSTLDEAPGAYKPMQLILDQIHETVDIIKMVKPILNIKAGE